LAAFEWLFVLEDEFGNEDEEVPLTVGLLSLCTTSERQVCPHVGEDRYIVLRVTSSGPDWTYLGGSEAGDFEYLTFISQSRLRGDICVMRVNNDEGGVKREKVEQCSRLADGGDEEGPRHFILKSGTSTDLLPTNNCIIMSLYNEQELADHKRYSSL
jgi:hypothetical protein